MSKENENNKPMTVQDFILQGLNQPVMIKGGDTAKDPRDGHEYTATEAIAMKMLQQALSGDVKSAQFVMGLQAQDQARKQRKK